MLLQIITSIAPLNNFRCSCVSGYEDKGVVESGTFRAGTDDAFIIVPGASEQLCKLKENRRKQEHPLVSHHVLPSQAREGRPRFHKAALTLTFIYMLSTDKLPLMAERDVLAQTKAYKLILLTSSCLSTSSCFRPWRRMYSTRATSVRGTCAFSLKRWRTYA